MRLHNLINIILIKRLMKSGQRRSCLTIINSFKSILRDERLFYVALLHLMIPAQQCYIANRLPSNNRYVFIHFYKSLSLAVSWLVKGALNRKNRKMSLSKALYLECCDVIKRRGLTYMLKRNYLKQLMNNY